ncbi:MAG: hypothetical protein IH987_07925 [Planctomycetes bacterium]|nr:hypothetical protein [Planctomycetota bacterium]
MPETVEPYALALVVADNVHRDPGTGKVTILGTFSVIIAKEFPAKHGIIVIYFVLTDGHGKSDCTIRLVTVDEDVTIAEATAEVDFSDPRAIVEGVVAMQGVVFPSAGEYRLQLVAGTTLLLERRIIVQKAGQ